MLLLQCIKKYGNIKSVLNLSQEKIILDENLQIHNYITKNNFILPFSNHSFDFIYCKNPLEIFINPCFMYSELIRVGKSGLIVNSSPISTLLYSNDKLITWTDAFSNSLCFMPHYATIDMIDIKIHEWNKQLVMKPYLLNDWYRWDQTNEFNIKMYVKDFHFNDIMDYEILYNLAIEESLRNTNNILND